MPTKKEFRKFIQKNGTEYHNRQTVRLGKLDGVTVETGTAGLLWARQWNGKEIKVRNAAFVPSDFDLRVQVGISWDEPGVWVILKNMEDYLTPATGGRVAYHHAQHEFGGPDEVQIDRRQITAYAIRATNPASFSVTVYGGYFPSESGFGYTPPSTVLDLSSYTTAPGHTQEAGAYYVAIEVDNTGALSINDTGSNLGSPFVRDISYVPTPATGKRHVGYVWMYEGQTAILDDHIRVPMPLGFNPTGYITGVDWGDIGGTLADQTDLQTALDGKSDVGHDHFDDSEGDPEDVTTGSAADGTSDFAARRDHVHHIDLTPVGQYRQFVTIGDGAGGWEFITFDGEPLLILQDLE